MKIKKNQTNNGMLFDIHELKLLEYFNINTQRADVVQFLSYHKDLTYQQLCDHIENDCIFMKTDNHK